MAKSTPIDPNNPKGTADPKKGDDQIRKTNAGVIEIINVDHYVGADTPDIGYDEDAAGEHLQATLHARTSPVSVGATKGVVFAKTVDSIAELFYIDENEAEVQLTRGGKVHLTKNIIDNDTYLQGDNAAGDGFVPLVKAGRNEADDADVAILPDAVRTATNAVATEPTGVANLATVDAKILASMTPTSESDAAGSAGVTTFPNGFKIARGTVSVSPGVKTISPAGFTAVYSATVTVLENTTTDRSINMKIGSYSGGSFTIRNTESVNTYNISYIAVGR